MTKIKMCGLFREEDVRAANEVKPDFVGFVFAKKSRRYVDETTAKRLRSLLDPQIRTVGVFVNEAQETVAELLQKGIISVAQLHGCEDEEYIKHLRTLTNAPVWKAFSASKPEELKLCGSCSADLILIDSGNGGTGEVFDWNVLSSIDRPYFLAGGLDPQNAAPAVTRFHPYGVDVSSGIESNGVKDPVKMKQFAEAVRSCPERI